MAFMNIVSVYSPASLYPECSQLGKSGGMAKRIIPIHLALTLILSFCSQRVSAGFIQPPTYSTGRGASSIAAADLNGDGIVDLAVTNEMNGTVSILLGKGDGTFQVAQTQALGVANFVALGDFNGDGKLDLAVAGIGVNILLGNGDGTFCPPQNYPIGPYPPFVAVGDFNGDGGLAAR